MSGPLIFTDRHHHALMESLELTLGDRLGAQVYYPYGLDWFEREYWSFERAWHGDAVAKQYLLGVWGDPEWLIKGPPLDDALTVDWDIVLTSLPHNYDGYYRFARETGARYGVQIGNEAQPIDPRADFCLSSSTLPGFGPEWIGKVFNYHGVPTLMYHQEFSLDTFRHEWPPKTKAIGSFIQCFAENRDWYAEFRDIARSLSEFDWRVYGSYGSSPMSSPRVTSPPPKTSPTRCAPCVSSGIRRAGATVTGTSCTTPLPSAGPWSGGRRTTRHGLAGRCGSMASRHSTSTRAAAPN